MLLYLRHAIITLFFILSCSAVESTLDIPSFNDEWNQFLQSKNISESQMDNDTDLDNAFLLVEAFGHLQLNRQRPIIECIDRYKNCRPYLENKVTLSDGTEMSASFIQLPGIRTFIASQAPFKSNVNLFWQMIAEQHISQIVMLTELFDPPNPLRELAYPYWPEFHEKLILENGIEITLIEQETFLSEVKEHILVRKFNLHYEDEDRIITHYWYRNWADDTAPDQLQTLLSLIEALENHKNSSASHVPVLVHCSAGVGRTGVFLTIYYLSQAGKIHIEKMNVFDFVAYLRWQRPFMVSRLPQYKFCCEAQASLSSSMSLVK